MSKQLARVVEWKCSSPSLLVTDVYYYNLWLKEQAKESRRNSQPLGASLVISLAWTFLADSKRFCFLVHYLWRHLFQPRGLRLNRAEQFGENKITKI